VVSAAGDKCAVCGASSQICCGTNNGGSCMTGLGCMGRNRATGMAGTCGACGSEGQACCSTGGPDDAGIASCMSGLSCTLSATGRQCAACGAQGQTCCGTRTTGSCMSGLGCGGRNSDMGVPGTCGPCGGAGQACCSTSGGDGGVAACMAGLSCRAMVCSAISDGSAAD
jgi:hypothetical protein